MTTFTIDCDNNIMAFASLQEAQATDIAGAEYFSSEEELRQLAASWPVAGTGGRGTSKLIELWNSLPGVPAVKKFTDRKSALARIWKASQALTPPGAPQARQDAPTRTKAPKKAGKDHKRATARPRARKAGGGRQDSKTAKILALLERSNGASLKDLMDATGWQAHSVRGFLSAQVRKKLGRKLRSTAQDGERRYQIAPK